MDNSNRQVVTLAQSGLTPQEIAENTGYELDSVLIILEQHKGQLYGREDDALALMNGEFKKCLPNMILNMQGLALGSEDDGIKFKATAWILEHQLGLKKPARASVTNNFTIMQLSETIKKSKDMVRARAMECGVEAPREGQLVDV